MMQMRNKPKVIIYKTPESDKLETFHESLKNDGSELGQNRALPSIEFYSK
jgi:hypothetical protein